MPTLPRPPPDAKPAIMNRPYVKEGIYGTWAGCYVQVPGTRGKLFSYSAYLTVHACRLAACLYADRMLAVAVLPRKARGFRYPGPTRRSKTKILGVHITRHHGKPVVVAECIGHCKRQWSIAKWGKAKALELAHKQRQAWEKTKWIRTKKT